jgi:plasmid stabilization system protein ParE
VRVRFRQIADEDVTEQYEYYLFTANVPEVAIRFRHSVTQTAQSLSHHPLVGQRVSSDISGYQNLRSYPISGFEFIRIYYVVDGDVLRIIRVLHGMRNVRRILKNE